MSNIEQIDFSTLIWVKKELDETLDRAKNAIEAYIEDPDDENQLQFCATYLHQVQGTLKMVELYGAAMVAEEMEDVAKKILAKDVDSEKDAFSVLMRGIILLPDYLERIQLGYKDIPMVLLPLVNDLRTVKGDSLLSESALFNPDLSLGLPQSNLTSTFELSHSQLNQVVKKIRSAYQVCLLKWLKDTDVQENLKKIQIILDKLKTVIADTDEKQLFWVAGGLFEALISGGLEKSVTVKQLAARLDQAIRLLTITDDSQERPYKKLTNNFLYYVALADKKDRRIKEIQDFFNLASFISDDREIEHAQSSVSGKNRELLETVTGAIKEDLMTIQEKLDLYNRSENADIAEIGSIIKSLSKIADTLGIIGVGVARSRIKTAISDLEQELNGNQAIASDTIMSVAETLIFVESILDENIISLGEMKEEGVEEGAPLIPSSEMRKIMDILAKESIYNFQKIKQNFVQYIETPWDKESIATTPKLLKDISGALKMSGLVDISNEIAKIENFTTTYMIDSDIKLSVDQLDILAECVASLEYYLEYVSDGTKGDDSILELAQSKIEQLFKSVEKLVTNLKDSKELDADLDSMSDDDFEMDFETEDTFEEELGIDANKDLALTELEETPPAAPHNEVLIVAFSDDTDDDIKEVFLEEFEEELEHLESIYPKWQRNPEEQTEILGEIRRIYHTLKGSGMLVGALAIGDYSWKIEEMINMALNKSIEINDSYLKVMKGSKEILPGLLEALQKKLPVPNGYYEIIKAAEKVMNGEEISNEDLEYSDATETTASIISQTEESVEIVQEEAPIIIPDEVIAESIEQLHEETEESPEESIEQLHVETEESPEESIEQLDEYIEEEGESDDLSVDPVFVEILQQEVEGHLNDVEKYINNAKAKNDYKVTEQFIRTIHTLNGAANMASVVSIVDMTTPIEHAAKLSLELEKEFDLESIEQLIAFRDESEDIMKNLIERSASVSKTAGIGSFFIDKFEKLAQEKEKLASSLLEDETASEFDLSEFIDTGDEIELSANDLVAEDPVVGLIDSELNAEVIDFQLDEEIRVNIGDSNHEQTLAEEVNITDDLNDDLSIEEISFDLDFVETTEETKAEVEEVETEEVETEEAETEEVAIEEVETEEAAIEEAEIEEAEIEEVETEEAETEEAETEEVETEEVAIEEFETAQEVIATSYGSNFDDSTEGLSLEFDEELLEIFKEEADDILDRTEHVIADLENNPKDTTIIQALQRDLHTLKGGARMAGLVNIGDLGHGLESLLEIIGEENRVVDGQTLSVIHDSFDLLNRMKNQNDFGQTIDISPVIIKIKEIVGLTDADLPEESKLDQDYLEVDTTIEPMSQDLEDDEVETSVQISETVKKSNVLSGNQIKVNSELLDNLVNYAGEVSIYRSRLEEEIGSFRVNLSELGNTVARIRVQLRKLDTETETQIISTFQTEGNEEGFDPLEMDRFSQLQQLSRSLTESVSDLTSIHSYLDDVARTSDNLLAQQSRVNTELQEGLMETRLVSFNSIVPRLRRLVRTTSKELDKPVKLEIHGAEGEMDKTVLEGVIAPLEHMLRNSLAHGIEEDRSRAKKPQQGIISIDVRREATEVVISITDDGSGIDRKKVRKLATQKGLIKKGVIISDKDIDRLILNSGFSTVEKVSKLAGRGVGMDVVSNQINLLGGSLDISSEPNKGTKFSIRLPYTLALSSALLVEIGETVFAIPVSGLEGIIRMSYADYLQRTKDGNFVYSYAHEDYQMYDLDKLLVLGSELVIENNQVPLVMIRSGEDGVALRVDRILGSREIVVKTVGAQVSSVPGIYGATILGDGNVVLILDIIPLSREYLARIEKLDGSEEVEVEVEKDPIVMIVDDSITMRKVGERILRRNNYEVTTARDGLDALEQLTEVIPDVMLLDIEMPRMDGYELAIEMKKEAKYANIPIIMITSRTGEKHRQKAMDLGVDRYLGKPYQEANLLANISELIEEHKGE